MSHDGVVRKTKSICPVCLEPLDAFVIEFCGKIFLSKQCFKHGKFDVLLSNTPEYYKEMERFYFAIMGEEKGFLSMKCGLL